MSWLAIAVQNALNENTGLAVGKLGTTEAECLYTAFHGYPWNGPLRTQMTRNAGLWPATNSTLSAWAQYMRHTVLPDIDHVIQWYDTRHEAPVLDAWAPNAKRHSCLDDLNAWAFTPPWTSIIPPGTRVAIVTPFAASINTQISHIASLPSSTLSPIWANPPPTFFTVRTGCSPIVDAEGPAAWTPDQLTAGWKSVIEEIVGIVVAGEARMAFIGCGALSLPIAVALKKRGIISIHLGGALQVLFGVRGRRWNTDPVIGPWMKEASWCNPLPEETPRNARVIEGGCYWY